MGITQYWKGYGHVSECNDLLQLGHIIVKPLDAVRGSDLSSPDVARDHVALVSY